MQRLYAASCLLFALTAPVARLHGDHGANVKCVQEPSAQGAQPTPAEPKQDPTQETKPAPAVPVEQDSKAADIPATSTVSAALPIDIDLIEQAKAGDAKAQYKLGYDYYKGHGIAQDYAQAAVWWKKSADQGFAYAQNNLGVLYNSGMGVPQSYSEAYFWQNLAAASANGDMQVLFAKNRDESAARLGYFERLRVQKRASKWANAHPVPPRSHEPPPDHP
jgi:TPR repeat protein